MGMGYAGNYADVIEFDTVRQLCQTEAEVLEQVLNKYHVDVETLAQTFQFEEPEYETLQERMHDNEHSEGVENYEAYVKEGLAAITHAFRTLQAAFANETAVDDSHLELRIGYHSAVDDGGRYDEVDGVFWAVDGMYQLSPVGKQFSEKVNRQFFVTYG